MGETPGRGRGTLFWVSRGYVWTSQGQKQGWKVGSGALLRKGLLTDFRQSSFLPPEEERKRKKKEKKITINSVQLRLSGSLNLSQYSQNLFIQVVN